MPEQNAQPNRWYLIPVRVFVATFVVTLMSFAVSLFLGTVGVLIAAHFRTAQPHMHVKPDLTIAYRDVAGPTAADVGAIVLVSSAFLEYRHHRQVKTLDRIATVSRS
jgi:hypothetical protein